MTICLLVTLHCFLVAPIKMRRSQSDRRGKKQSRHLPWLEPWGQWHEWMWWWCKSSLLWPDSTLYHCGVSDDQLQTQNVVEIWRFSDHVSKKVLWSLVFSSIQCFKISKQESDIIIKRTWQCCDWRWPHIAKLHQVLVSWTDTLTLFPTPPDFQYLVAPNWDILVMVRMMMPMMMILVCLRWPLLTSCTLGDDAVEQYMQIVTITQSSEWQCIYIDDKDHDDAISTVIICK